MKFLTLLKPSVHMIRSNTLFEFNILSLLNSVGLNYCGNRRITPQQKLFRSSPWEAQKKKKKKKMVPTFLHSLSSMAFPLLVLSIVFHAILLSHPLSFVPPSCYFLLSSFCIFFLVTFKQLYDFSKSITDL